MLAFPRSRSRPAPPPLPARQHLPKYAPKMLPNLLQVLRVICCGRRRRRRCRLRCCRCCKTYLLFNNVCQVIPFDFLPLLSFIFPNFPLPLPLPFPFSNFQFALLRAFLRTDFIVVSLVLLLSQIPCSAWGSTCYQLYFQAHFTGYLPRIAYCLTD